MPGFLGEDLTAGLRSKGIHCAATEDRATGQDELDEIAINNFINTLAEVALAMDIAIGSRKASALGRPTCEHGAGGIHINILMDSPYSLNAEL